MVDRDLFTFQINAKYNDELAHQCLEWMRDMINSHLVPGEAAIQFHTSGDKSNFSAVLHNGVVLARFDKSIYNYIEIYLQMNLDSKVHVELALLFNLRKNMFSHHIYVFSHIL